MDTDMTTERRREARYLIVKAHNVAERLDQRTRLTLADYTTMMLRRPHSIDAEQLRSAITLARAVGQDAGTRALGNEMADALAALQLNGPVVERPTVLQAEGWRARLTRRMRAMRRVRRPRSSRPDGRQGISAATAALTRASMQ